jgi:hypothetical protein
MDLSSYSCSDLKAEIIRRRTDKEVEINARYRKEREKIKDQFRDFKSLDKKLPIGLRLSDILRHFSMSGSDSAYEVHKLLSEYTEWGYDDDTERKVADIRDNLLLKIVTPSALLDFWEKTALSELDRQRLEEISKLY